MKVSEVKVSVLKAIQTQVEKENISVEDLATMAGALQAVAYLQDLKEPRERKKT